MIVFRPDLFVWSRDIDISLTFGKFKGRSEKRSKAHVRVIIQAFKVSITLFDKLKFLFFKI